LPRVDDRGPTVGVEVGVVAADRAGVFQGSEPAVAGGEAETDPLGEFGEGYSPVLLKLGKDLSVYGIHVDDPCSAQG
jgi:hypothetical protein